VKATFELGQTLRVADKQEPLVGADEFWGEPGKSSLKRASEVHLPKPGTDVILLGEACAPERRPVYNLDVSLRVGARAKTLRVFGERQWNEGAAGLIASAPLPFESMPLVYERAFGGAHIIDAERHNGSAEERNPVGRGFAGARSWRELRGMALPNLEDPAQLLRDVQDCPPPACFSFVAPAWLPRRQFAGTYDQAWQKQRAPYLPTDFNPRFFNMAHPDWIFTNYLQGGEPVEIVNASPRGALRFALPHCQFDVDVIVAGKREKPTLNLESVIIEPSAARLTLLWRAAIICDKKLLRAERADIQLHSMEV